MLSLIVGVIYLTGVYPLLRAWRANRRTSLFQAVHWMAAAWVAWGVVVWGDAVALAPQTSYVVSYLAFCLTGCAGVAVLGARRPGVGPWNFVLLGLLAVMLLPLAEGLLARGALHLEGPRLLFLAATLAVIVLNYLPTRLGPAALVLGCAGVFQLCRLAGLDELRETLTGYAPVGNLLLAFVPWAAYERMASRPLPSSEFDRIWRDFRDRFGLVWSQRTREQFNASASHAGWPVVLRWQGLRLVPGSPPLPEETQQAMVDVLQSLLKRFRAEEQPEAPP
jgi:hypothetical protein